MSELIFTLNNMSVNSVVLGLSALAFFLSLFVFLREHQITQKLNKQLQRLEHELRVANGSAIGMGQQLISFEKKLNQQHVVSSPVQDKEPSAQYEKFSAQPKEPLVQSQKKSSRDQKQTTTPKKNNDIEAQSVYEQAREALSRGLDVGDVAKQCGLSFAEVSLLKSLSKGTITSY
ncbi:MAG: hypothetical protein ACJAUP_001784 [Cellvibrionaceae bacterium]|jgi:hypothetical protein